MERLNKGTKEFLVIPITDTLNNLSPGNFLMLSETDALILDNGNNSLTAATYDIYTDDDDETAVLEGANAVVDGMNIFPLIDTSDMEEGDYKLFVTFSALPEVPRLGPFRFKVDD